MNVFDKLLASLDNLWSHIQEYGPRVALALAVLLIGWMVARLVRRGVIKLFRLMHMDEAAEKSGVEAFLLRGGVRFTAVTLIGETVYWLIFFLIIFLAMDVLGLDAANHLLGRILFYLPNVFIAAAILIFGSLIAKFVSALINAYLNNVGVQGGHIVSAVARASIMVFVVFVAFEQLSIEMKMLESAFQIVLGGVALAFGLAFGLGGQDVAKRTLDKIYKTLS